MPHRKQWRDDNTEGFTDEDLEILNEAQEDLAYLFQSGDGSTEDPQVIAGWLNNAWIDGKPQSVHDLVSAVLTSKGH